MNPLIIAKWVLFWTLLHTRMLRVSDSTRQTNCSMWNLRFIPYSNNLPKVQLIVVYLRNKDGSHRLIECRPIHVDGGSHRQHKPCNPPVHMVILQQALESDRQCGWAAKQQTEAHIELFLFLGHRMNCSKPPPRRVNFTLTMWALLLIPWSACVTHSFAWGGIKTFACINGRVSANFASPKLKITFSLSLFLKRRVRNPAEAVLYTQMQDRGNTLCSGTLLCTHGF